MTKLTAEFLFDDLIPAEKARAERVESVLPELRAHAEEADASGRFYESHRETLAKAGAALLDLTREGLTARHRDS